MNLMLILSVVIIGFAAGLRALTAPAVIAWCAYLGCIDLSATPFAFMASWITVAIFSLLALGEYVGDVLPSTPNRTAPPGLIARLVTGAFAAACLLAATNNSLAFCVLGGIAAIAGAFAGLQIRTRLVTSFAVNGAWIAVPEDIVAIVMSLSAVFLLAAL